MFTQQFRQLDACRSKLQSEVMAELAAETEEKRRETERLKADNKRRAAAVETAPAAAAAAAAQRTTPTTCDANGSCGEDGDDDHDDDDDDDDDGYGSEVLIPVPPSHDGVASRTSSPPTSSSSGRGGLPLPEEGSKPTAALSGGSTSASTPLPAGDGTGASTSTAAVGATGAGKRSRSTATAAATAATSGQSAPTAAGAPRKGDARPAVRFLEDLLPAPGQVRRSKPRARAADTASGSGSGGNAGQRSKKKTKRAEHEHGEPAPTGPFSGLRLCVVHLGSVTSNTIKTFEKGVRSGGGNLSTHYTPRDTTHIVADASLALSWEKLDLYFSGWDDFEDDVGDTGGKAGEARTGAPDGVPIVSSEWMSECLRRSALVPTDAYLLIPSQRRAAAAAAVIPPASSAGESSSDASGKSSIGGGGGGDASAAAAAAAAASKRNLASADEETGGLAAASARPPERKQARGAGEGGAPAKSRTLPVEGGHGAKNPYIGKKRHTFFCQATGFGPQTVFNEEAAQKLERLAELCATRGGDGSVFRERGFKAAAGVLRRLGVQITNIEQLKDLRKNEPERVRGLGESVMKELTTFYEEGRMNRLDGLEADPKLRCLELFQKVSWVGPKKAEELHDNGLRSIEDLRAGGQHLLTEQARICLNRHEDITQRMPRSEAAEVEAVVTREAQSICPGAICQACGSYRRGKSHCGDVDVLIRPPEGQEDVELLLELVSRLTAMGFITDTLAMPHGACKPGKPQSYMGICKLEGEGRLHRRVDIKVYPTSMFAFAVLYFTGSGHFNTSMRAFAKAKGLKLSDQGLFKVNTVNGKEVHRFEDSCRCLHEKDVFAALGLEWREPKDRDGVQVEGVYGRRADGALELKGGQAVPVPSDLEQRQRASLQQQQQQQQRQQRRFPAAHAGGYYHQDAQLWQQQQQQQQQQRLQKQEHERMMRQQAAAYFQQKEDEELQQALLLSRGAFGAGAGAATGAATGGAGVAMETGNHGNGCEDQMVQEALRRSVAETAAAARLGGEEERVWETLPPEAMAGGGGGGGGGDGGDSGVGAGTEDSPVCL